MHLASRLGLGDRMWKCRIEGEMCFFSSRMVQGLQEDFESVCNSIVVDTELE